MKTNAAVVREINKLSIETVELDAPKASEVLMRARAAHRADSAGGGQAESSSQDRAHARGDKRRLEGKKRRGKIKAMRRKTKDES